MSTASVVTTFLILVIVAIVATFATIRIRKVTRESRSRSQAREAALLAEVARFQQEAKSGGADEVAAPQTDDASRFTDLAVTPLDQRIVADEIRSGQSDLAGRVQEADQQVGEQVGEQVGVQTSSSGETSRSEPRPALSAVDEMRAFLGEQVLVDDAAVSSAEASNGALAKQPDDPDQSKQPKQSELVLSHSRFGADHFCAECSTIVDGRIVRLAAWD